ncbi:MAG: tetratricopeptide repeat protein [Bacteroidetes bacterium]|nr:tetratricopeptide repeat protein [Bacteroidota bacterium]
MNLKTFRYLLLLKTALFIGMQSAPAQSHSIPDSLNTIINSAASDSVKIEAYTQLFNFHYRKLKIKEASDVANKSLDFSLKCKNKKGIADSYNNLAITMSEMGKLAEAKKYFLLSLEMRRELNDKKFLAKTLGNLEVYIQRWASTPNQYSILQVFKIKRRFVTPAVGPIPCICWVWRIKIWEMSIHLYRILKHP